MAKVFVPAGLESVGWWHNPVAVQRCTGEPWSGPGRDQKGMVHVRLTVRQYWAILGGEWPADHRKLLPLLLGAREATPGYCALFWGHLVKRDVEKLKRVQSRLPREAGA